MIQQTSERIVQYQNEMKILILYGVIGSMATVDSALFSSSAIRVIKMIVLSLSIFAKPGFSEITCNEIVLSHYKWICHPFCTGEMVIFLQYAAPLRYRESRTPRKSVLPQHRPAVFYLIRKYQTPPNRCGNRGCRTKMFLDRGHIGKDSASLTLQRLPPSCFLCHG